MLLLRTQQPRIDLADFKKLSRKQLNHHVNVEARAFMRALSGPFWVSSAILTVTLIAFRNTTLMANVLGSFGPVLGPALAAPTNPDPEPQAGRNPDLPTVTPTRECDEGSTEDEYDSWMRKHRCLIIMTSLTTSPRSTLMVVVTLVSTLGSGS
jgi:hypothetical protein